MNERIKELWEESTGATIPAEGFYSSASTYNIEKFAELIVRECTNAIVNDSRLNDVRSAANGCVRTIRERFGVEE
jgi:hypothetical protein